LYDHIPAEGRDVPLSDYWHRRLLDGDVIEGAAPVAVAAAAPATAATDSNNYGAEK
jgi:hypothetical protein